VFRLDAKMIAEVIDQSHYPGRGRNRKKIVPARLTDLSVRKRDEIDCPDWPAKLKPYSCRS
jgi:hypothetical protein